MLYCKKICLFAEQQNNLVSQSQLDQNNSEAANGCEILLCEFFPIGNFQILIFFLIEIILY